MKLSQILSLLLILTALPFAQEATKKEIPAIPSEDKVKLLQLVVKQKLVQQDENELIAKYKADVEKLDNINSQGREITKQVFVKLGLDPEKYDTETTKDGDIVIVEKPVQSTKEAK